MLLSWLRNRVSPAKKTRRRPVNLILRTEGLEDRAVPSATLVRDINTSSGHAFAATTYNSGVELNGRIYFFADDGIHGRELWSTDGTSQGTQLVKDINPGIAPSNVGVSGIARIGNKLVFSADDGVHGTELWISDGTADGTKMLKDIATPSDSTTPSQFVESSPSSLVSLGDKVVFTASDPQHGQELWVTDGTAEGTQLLRDILPGNAPSNIFELTAIGDRAYFSANDGIHGAELWVTDGTADGTKMVADIALPHSISEWNPVGSSPMFITNFKGQAVFVANDNLHGNELWITDGTAEGTRMIIDLNDDLYNDPHGVEKTWGSNPSQLTAVGDTLYFVAFNGNTVSALWATDGTAEGTVSFAAKIGEGGNAWIGLPYSMATDGTTLWIASSNSSDGVYNTELWRTDGTADGTTRLGRWDEPPYNLPTQKIQRLLEVENEIYLAAGNALAKVRDDGVEFVEKFDNPSATGPLLLGQLGDKVFFTADDGKHGTELFRLEDDGLVLVKDINTTTHSSTPRELLTIGHTTYFTAYDGIEQGLWKSDGTANGTTKVFGFAPAMILSDLETFAIPPLGMVSISNLTEFQGQVFFTVYDGGSSAQLWKSDGTTAGTVPLTGIIEGESNPSPSSIPGYVAGVGQLTVMDDTLFFTRSSGYNHTELWKTDGSVAGTEMVRTFHSDYASSPPVIMSPGTSAVYGSIVSNLINVNGTLFFTADDGVHGEELWRSDGTEAGTWLVKDINPAMALLPPDGPNVPQGSQLGALTEFNGKLYFAANDGVHGRELWVSDGTAEGTKLAVEFAPGAADGLDLPSPSGSSPTQILAAHGKLYLNANDGQHGQELWISDGTAAGTTMLRNIHPEATSPVYPFETIAQSSTIQHLTLVGNTVFFTANDGIHGHELWKTDGTAAGTVMVKDIFEGQSPHYPGGPIVTNNSLPSGLTHVNGVLYFIATDAEHGTEIWTSDGTAAGTKLAFEINPGPSDSFFPWSGEDGPAVTARGDQVLFNAWSINEGFELFAATSATKAAPPVTGPVFAGGPYHVVEGGSLTLQATVIDRPDSAWLRYAWDLDGDGQFDDAKGASPTMVGAQLRALGLMGGPEVRTVGVLVTDLAGNEVGTATAQLTIDDAPLTASGVTLDVTEGQKFNRNVATFKDPGGFEELSHYSATIDWGDGTTSAGTIIRDGSQLRVAGSHTYAKHGSYNVTVSIQDDGGPAVTANSTVQVQDAGLYGGRQFLRGTAGREISGAIATFRDQNPSSDAADFTAEITWGNGQTTVGTIVALGDGNYQVLGTQTYSTAGDYAVTVKILSSGGSSTTVLSSVKVDPVQIVPRGLTANAQVGVESLLAVAAFRDSDRSAVASLYTAVIDWADGTTSDGIVESDGIGGFRISGNHQYARTGLYSVRVTITDAAGNSAQAIGTVRALP